MKKTNLIKTLTALCLFVGSIVTIQARTFSVNSLSSYNNAVSNANNGDVISWRQGTFKDIDIRLTKSGITLKAEVAGKTIFNGASKLFVTGDDNIIDGISFIGGNIGAEHVLTINGDRNLFTNMITKDYFCTRYVLLNASGQRNTFKYNLYQNRTFIGPKNIFQVSVSETEPSFTVISHCKFLDFDGLGNSADFGVEAIRIGNTYKSDREFISRSVVEYCYFSNCNGDSETISNKSSENIYRYNTFEDNPFGTLVLRHGSRCVVYGNFFIKTQGGVRMRQGQDHFIYNNYLTGQIKWSFNIQNSDVDAVGRVLIAHNTIVNSAPVRLGGGVSDKSTEPTNVTIANNIFSDTSNTRLLRDPTGTERFVSNLVDGRLGINENSGLIRDNPELFVGNAGFFQLASTSPAIDNAKSFNVSVKSISGLTADFDIELDLIKNPRPTRATNKDIGAQERTQGNVIKPHATKNNTGPRHLQSNNTNVNPQVNITSPSNGEVFNLGETIDISANASDADGTVKRVLFVTNNDTIRYDNTAPYTASFRPTKPGNYTIFANARDNENDNGDDQITITVTEDIKGPDGYTYNVDEEETVSITNTIDIAFGAIGEFTYLFNQTSDVVCEVNSFGSDPVKGFKKRCFTRPSADYTPPFTYVVSVDQNQVVNASGKQDIAFGANGNFKYLMNQTGDVTCDESTFGDDPAKGYKKKCFVRPSADFTPPLGYSLSSNEGETIEVDESLDIAYGVNGKFEFLLNQNNDVTCNNIDFGNDPEKGYIKKCFTRKAVVTSTSDKTSLGEIVVFPNPSENGIYHISETIDWEVFNLKGQQILTGDSEKINLSAQSNGIYFLKVGGQVIKLVRK